MTGSLYVDLRWQTLKIDPGLSLWALIAQTNSVSHNYDLIALSMCLHFHTLNWRLWGLGFGDIFGSIKLLLLLYRLLTQREANINLKSLRLPAQELYHPSLTNTGTHFTTEKVIDPLIFWVNVQRLSEPDVLRSCRTI